MSIPIINWGDPYLHRSCPHDLSICGVIYIAENLINGKIYIGQTKGKIRRRILSHFRDAKNIKNKNRPFISALIKYGSANFQWFILESNVASDQLDNAERYWISLMNKSLLYNATKGGSGYPSHNNRKIRNHTNDELMKISVSLKEWYTEHPEDKLKKSERYSGTGNPFYGKTHSEEVKENLKRVHYNPIECLNIETGEIFIVSGTRNAANRTDLPRYEVVKLLRDSTKNSKYKWRFKRL